MMLAYEDCCTQGVCNKNDGFIFKQKEGLLSTSSSSSPSPFFKRVKGLYAALGVEILCIAAAEIGENTGLYLFSFNLVGIQMPYATGYALAGFTTYATIPGEI